MIISAKLLFFAKRCIPKPQKPPGKNDPDCLSSQFPHFYREAFLLMKQITTSYSTKNLFYFNGYFSVKDFTIAFALSAAGSPSLIIIAIALRSDPYHPCLIRGKLPPEFQDVHHLSQMEISGRLEWYSYCR